MSIPETVYELIVKLIDSERLSTVSEICDAYQKLYAAISAAQAEETAADSEGWPA